MLSSKNVKNLKVKIIYFLKMLLLTTKNRVNFFPKNIYTFSNNEYLMTKDSSNMSLDLNNAIAQKNIIIFS